MFVSLFFFFVCCDWLLKGDTKVSRLYFCMFGLIVFINCMDCSILMFFLMLLQNVC
jgi:hypothetical protein